ncbi:MSHA biogenesis protein MshM [Georgfuchsia toluolica]|uniref:MSHA biogenesis protein MshM n=1 Tax=Georgfuchsia toluolica TaxID=424218 RepID=A0A916J756_9PROT|nr:AAA family ATPase [Georgfuchsia toluolica]CAG4885199.1 MSHA biogenesis protein MshM [Georgfuchsia toluolica]
MYLAHFGLRELPFGITPDTQYIYSATAHQEALNTLMLAVEGGEGFVKITGEVGTGKTLLCRKFLSMLVEPYFASYIPNPQFDPRALLGSVAEELGAPAEGEASHIIKSINRRLLALADEGRTVVLCIDEAQTMPQLTLETIRLLSNLETEKRKLIQIVLFGQPELDMKLAEPSVRQLRQRIAFHYRMPPLQRRELNEYVSHRLRIAGYHGDPLFSPLARSSLYRFSGGTPRLVNILAHKSMLSAFGEGRPSVGLRQVLAAARDTEGARFMPWIRP